MTSPRPLTVVCFASYFKGEDFLRECRRQGCRVILITAEKLAREAWPRESIDELRLMPDLSKRDDVIRGVSYLARTRDIDRIVPLDEYDVETAAALREHLRVPGMGETTARYFRDKLAMRLRARERALLVPEFTPVFTYDRVRDWLARVPPPWLLKPRASAATMGIRKLHEPEQLWQRLDELGDEQSFHVLERFVPGDIYHVDSIVSEREVLFSSVHRYGRPPMTVAHEGGLSTTRTVPRGSPQRRALQGMNRDLIAALGLVRGVTHAEFIEGRDDGRFYFLEIAARVAGAHIADVVAAATGLNLWVEWARIETATEERPYHLPPARELYAGSIISLARQERPDTSAYDDPEIVWRLERRHHAGLIVASPDPERVESLLESYARRFHTDFFATLPPAERPTA